MCRVGPIGKTQTRNLSPVRHDHIGMVLLYDSESPMVPPREEEAEYELIGWRLVAWFGALTWECLLGPCKGESRLIPMALDLSPCFS